jgi:hypothetical protein
MVCAHLFLQDGILGKEYLRCSSDNLVDPRKAKIEAEMRWKQLVESFDHARFYK